MTTTELEQLVLDLEARVITLETDIKNLHLIYVTKIQWKELDELRQSEIITIQDTIANIEIEIEALQNAG